MEPTAAPPTRPADAFERLVLFDGVCGFCDRSVRWLIERDSQARPRFAPLQGETAAALRARHPQIPETLETMVYVERDGGAERVHLRSEAVLRICAELGRPWRALSWALWLPRWLTDLAYRLLARVRYRVFGKLDACALPGPGERGRFLP